MQCRAIDDFGGFEIFVALFQICNKSLFCIINRYNLLFALDSRNVDNMRWLTEKQANSRKDATAVEPNGGATATTAHAENHIE